MPCFGKISLLNLKHYTCTIIHYRDSIITWGSLRALICYTLIKGPLPPLPKPHLAVHLVYAVVHELHGVGVREELVS